MPLAKQKHNHDQGLCRDEKRREGEASRLPNPGGRGPHMTAAVLGGDCCRNSYSGLLSLLLLSAENFLNFAEFSPQECHMHPVPQFFFEREKREQASKTAFCTTGGGGGAQWKGGRSCCPAPSPTEDQSGLSMLNGEMERGP